MEITSKTRLMELPFEIIMTRNVGELIEMMGKTTKQSGEKKKFLRGTKEAAEYLGVSWSWMAQQLSKNLGAWEEAIIKVTTNKGRFFDPEKLVEVYNKIILENN